MRREERSKLESNEPERNKRVIGVGSVLFQILGIQQELGEELNLNGDLMEASFHANTMVP
ncbi:hypothetical protein FB451DRAFT_1396354 [Mycena latifolia]|nr:hypothetical protein FB451DRAFT_1396354 [Mycena latifolia]